jgi:hypothetical protein
MKDVKINKNSKEKLINGGLVISFFTTLLSILEKFSNQRICFLRIVFLRLLDLLRDHLIRGSP